MLETSGEQRFAKTPLAIPRHVWAELVGPDIARRSEPRTLDRGILTVIVPSSSWSAELSFLSEELLNRLRQRKYVVERLRFIVGKIDAPARPFEAEPDVVPALREIPKSLQKEIAEVPDDDLRAALQRAARAGLSRSAFLDERKDTKKRS